jgi:hypothetical protein
VERLVILTPVTIADIEMMPHDGKPHRMGAVQEFAILDRVAADIGGEFAGTPSVPAGPVHSFRAEG